MSCIISLCKCLIVLFCINHQASAATFRCFSTHTNYEEVSVKSPEGLLNTTNSCIDVNKQTYLVVLGYTFELEGDVATNLILSLLNRGDSNVMLLNWEKEAGEGGLSKLGYVTNALPNVKIVGEDVGVAFVKLVALGLSRVIRIISHSLGVQLAGYTGRKTQEKGLSLTEIIALDPARVGFEFPLKLFKSISKSDAILVTVGHCDPAGYALNKTIGHVDFWPNYGNYASKKSVRKQPGCEQGESDLEKYVGGNSCSHSRCWQYYNVSFANPTLFMGGKANNYYDWLKKNGSFDANEINYFSPQVNAQIIGDFYFVTSDVSPWGLGSGGLSQN